MSLKPELVKDYAALLMLVRKDAIKPKMGRFDTVLFGVNFAIPSS